MACMETIRLGIAFAAQKGWVIHQLDVESAILHGERIEDVLVEQPCGYIQKGNRIEAYFIKEGSKKCDYEHTLFVKQNMEGSMLSVNLYVDDLLFIGNDELMFAEFKNSMKHKFDMTDLGKMKYFLGLEILQKSCRIFISQRKYAQEMLQHFGMNQSNSIQTPIVPSFKLCKDEGGTKVDKTYFKQIVGCLMYLTATRPDMVFVVSLLSRYMENPTQLHLQLPKRVLRYLQETTGYEIFYKKRGNNGLIVYTDSDYAGDLDDRKSTSRNIFLFSCGVVSWSSKKQPIVSFSTTEAEFIVAASCSCQAIWLKRMLIILDQTQQETITIHYDSSFAIKLSRNLVVLSSI
ncbi:uncharacterized mitochondrial protein AtMg00810-like [Ricinus communis]|uniref:uncharacterized mitochondrial protein AtMg00810-like n=1 Tax=Ricinus communis TaxID=3988 RepID=UPI00201AA57D|nr:uncharacterized mitochondrial protein AtMg00810-like [Ricinus communis]